jgi:hypothetical protein
VKLFQKAKFFSGLWQMGKNRCLSHTHTGPKVVLTGCESFRSENSKKRNRFGINMFLGFCQSLQNYRRPTGKVIAKMLNATSFALFEWVWWDLFGRSDAHKDTRIVFIFANVAFLGISHMTNCSEMRDTKAALSKRVKASCMFLLIVGAIAISTVSQRFLSIHTTHGPPKSCMTVPCQPKEHGIC